MSLYNEFQLRIQCVNFSLFHDLLTQLQLLMQCIQFLKGLVLMFLPTQTTNSSALSFLMDFMINQQLDTITQMSTKYILSTTHKQIRPAHLSRPRPIIAVQFCNASTHKFQS